jgi:DNA-binding transcriptional MerR regulator
MSYKEILQKQIKELEQKIAEAEGDRAELQRQLSKLRLAEFEEDLAETENRTLLKG